MSQATVIRTTKEIPAEELLGYLTFQKIEDVRIHKNDLGALFDAHGLPRTFLPHEIKPHDAFRRATARAAGTIEIDNGGTKQTARLLVREVLTDNKQVIRHLVREIIDNKNVALDYATVGKMLFNRATNSLFVGWSNEYLAEYDYEKHLEDINTLFQDWTQFHTKDTVRNIVTKMIGSLNPVSVQHGGRATFIPKYGKDTLFSLKEMVAALPGGQSSIEILPLVDAEEVRDLIAKRAEEAVAGELNELSGAFAELLTKTPTLTTNQVKRYVSKFVELQQKTKEYQKLVNRNMLVINAQVQAALARVEEAPTKEGADQDEEVQCVG